MPWLVKDGQRTFVGNESVDYAVGNGWQFEDGASVVVDNTLGGGSQAVDPIEYERVKRLGLGSASTESQARALGDEAALEREYGGFSLQGAGESFLSGLTVGGSDVILSQVDPVGTRERRQRGDGTVIAGILGAALPAIASGGTGAIGAAARATPAGAIGAMGARIAGGGGAVRMAAAGAAEGALFGAGQGVSNVALSEDPVNAETLISEIGTNALYGGLLGAGAGVLTAGASAGLRKLKSWGENASRSRAVQNMDDLIAGNGSRNVSFGVADDLEMAAVPIAPELKIGVRMKDSFSHIDEAAGRSARLADEMVAGGQADEALMGMYSRQVKAREAVNHFFGDRSEDALMKGLKVGRRADAALAEYEQSTVALFNQTHFGKQDPSINGMQALFGSGIDDLTKSVQAAREAAKSSGFAFGVDLAKADLKAVQGAENLRQVDFGKDGKVISGVLDYNGKGFDQRTAVGQLNKARDNIGLGMSWAGSLIADFVPGGHTIGKVLRTVGFLDRAIGGGTKKLGTLVDVVLKTGPVVRRAAIPSATNILSNTHYGERKGPPPKTGREAFKLHAKELSARVADPERARADLNQSLLPVRMEDSALAEQIIANQMRTDQYLYGELPKSPGIGNPLQGKDRWEPNDKQLQTYARKVWITSDRTNILTAIDSGTLTYDDVKAYKVKFPETYEKIRMDLVARTPELQQEISYDRRIQLSVFFDVPVDTMMTPERIYAAQESYALAKEADGEKTATQETGRRGGLARLGKINKPEPTAGQRLIAR